MNIVEVHQIMFECEINYPPENEHCNVGTRIDIVNLIYVLSYMFGTNNFEYPIFA